MGRYMPCVASTPVAALSDNTNLLSVIFLIVGFSICAALSILLFIHYRHYTKLRMDHNLKIGKEILADRLPMTEENYWEYNTKTKLLKVTSSQSLCMGQRRYFYLQEYTDLVHPEDRKRLRESYETMVSGKKDIDYQQYRLLQDDGKYHSVASVRFTRRKSASSKVIGICGFTAPLDENAGFSDDNLKFERQKIMEKATGAGYWEINKSESIVFLTETASRIFFGKKVEQEMPVESFLDILSPGSAADFIVFTSDKNGYGDEFTMQLQAYIPEKNITRHIETFFKKYVSPNDMVPRIMAMSIDITSHIEKARNESYLAHHDEITGLYNRRDFNTRISSGELRRPFILVLCDFDGLKLVNDIMGHSVGDEMIRLLAASLRSSFPDSYIARIGGDEFAVICRGMNEKEVQDAIAEAEKYCRVHNKHYLDVYVSCGYCTAREQENFNDCFVKAENMLYHYKLGRRSSRKQMAKEKLLNQLYLVTSETGTHGDRVGLMASMILKEMDFHRAADERRIKLLGQLHDVGKLLIPRNILEKPGELDDDEWIIMKNHPKTGFKIVSNLIEDNIVAESVLYHHERWDGKGYPYGIEGNKIPLFARVISVVNTYDAMTHRQPYREPISHDRACQEIKKCSGTQFDPEVVEAFIRYMNIGN